MKKLFVIDLDGTLIPRDTRNISQYNKTAIEYVRNNGHLVAVASGRNKSCFNDTVDVVFDFEILSNGGYIASSDEYILENYFNKSDFSALIKYLESKDYHYYVLCDTGRYTTFKDSIKIKEFCNLYKIPYPPYSKKHIKKPYQVIVCENIDIVNGIKNKFNEFIIFNNPDFGIDIYNKEAKKEEGVLKLLEYLNADISNVICIGNSDNDYEMIKSAGIGACMESSNDKLKSISDYILNDNDESIGEFMISISNK